MIWGNKINKRVVIVCLDAATQFRWNMQRTKLLLEAYSERKQQFRDPKIKKKLLWHDIVQIFTEHGYTNVDEDLLDRKMRNMKRSYKTIKDNNKKNSTGRGRVSWEYYDILENIYAEDKTINHGSTLESTNIAGTSQKLPHQPPIANENHKTAAILNSDHCTNPSVTPLSDITNLENTSLQDCPSTSVPSTSPISSSQCSSDLVARRKKNTSLYNQRRKQQEIEQSRIAAINRLTESLDESNKIQIERNELIKQLLVAQEHQKE